MNRGAAIWERERLERVLHGYRQKRRYDWNRPASREWYAARILETLERLRECNRIIGLL